MVLRWIATCCLAGAHLPQVAPAIAFVGVTVVDPAAGARPGMTVVVKENRIVTVAPAGAAPLPREARVIPAQGKYLIPGLWDTHVHLENAGEPALPMLIAFGITGVRDMGAERFEPLRAWRTEILSGARVGPRIVAAGPIVDGPTPHWPLRVTVTDEAGARRTIDSLATVGVDFIKVHQQLGREAYFAIAAEARKLDLPFAGHVPNVVSGIEAAAAGQRSLEHMTGIPAPRDTALRATVAALVKYHTWIDPTLNIFWVLAHLQELQAADDPLNRYLSPSLRKFWEDQKSAWSGDMSPEARRKDYHDLTESLQALHRAKIPILVGTDLGFVFVYPGKSVHDELERLVEAGYSPLEAIRAATLNPAEYFGRSTELGSVAVGKLADLVLLDADPLTDIRNTRRINTVVANGRLFERSALDRLLEQVAEDVRR